MKKHTLTIVTTFLLCLGLPGFANAQSNCDEVKKENEYLKKSLKMMEPVMTQTVDNTEIRLVKCIGDAKSQTVKLEFLLINKQANKKVGLRESSGIDVEGNQYDTDNFKIGNETISAVINTEVPIKATTTLKKILPAVKLLKLFKLSYDSDNTSYKELTVEFRDIKVDWK